MIAHRPRPDETQSIQVIEEARIREAYARREKISRNIYSFLDPAFVLQIQERERQLLSIFRRYDIGPLEMMKVLEIGCGTGYWLRSFLQWGASPENVFGIDLLSERIEQARSICPRGVHLDCGNAANLPYSDASFDLVFQSTVFTSILDPAIKQSVAREMLRVVKPGGSVFWYDFRFDNPQNRDVRGVKRREIRELFPNCQIHFRRITLAPPVGRLIAHYSSVAYTVLSCIKVLCTHYLCLIQKS